MSTNTMPLEADTRVMIDRSLENLGWKFEGKERNVFLEHPRTEEECKKLGGKRPDYVLYSKDSDKPLMVIEAKKKGFRMDAALEQGIYYARALDAPLVFATDGVFCKSFHTKANRPPVLNGEEINELIRETVALRFLTQYEVNTVSPKVQYDRKELIRIFEEANNMLRGEGLRAGIERFGEFANILFLKLISENEQIKRDSGISTKFDMDCSWDSIRRIPSSSRIEYVNRIVYDKLNALYHTDIFTKLQITDSDILEEIMDALDPLMLTDVDSDVKGDAFEYFLKASTATKNDLGEYFTPRHIVKTMVRLINPQIGEKIYDPFCGTGGFLIESFRYICNNMARTEANMKMLREQTVYGNEITNTARITKMNMILAGDGHSNIKKQDSLAAPVEGSETYMDENGQLHHRGYDVVLANMPYSQKTKYGDLYDLPGTNGDSICVQHCMKAINSSAPNGRMALVVPEGFLFRKDLTKTREYLLERCQLQSIISLPQGVFLPYTGVKTDIIYATDVNKKVKSSEKRKMFWYFDVKSDGYTLDNHRRKLNTPSDLNKYEEYRKLDKDQMDDMVEVGFEAILLDKVHKNSSILVGSRYREAALSVSDIYNAVKLSDIAMLIRGISFPKSAQMTSSDENSLKIVTTRAAQTDGIDYNNLVCIDSCYAKPEKLIRQGDILISLANSLDFVGRVTYVDQNNTELSFGAFMGLIRADQTRVNPSYLFHILRSYKAKEYFKSVAKTTTNISNLTFEDLENFIFPLPDIKKQSKIASELDEYQKIILNAQNILKNYRPHMRIPADCSIVKLGEVCSINGRSVNPQREYGEKDFVYIDISSVESGTGKVNKRNLVRGSDAPSRARRAFQKGDILLSTVRPNLKAFVYVDFEADQCVASTGFAVLTPEKINGKYLFYMLFEDYIGDQLKDAMSKAMYPSINRADIENLRILLPEEDVQNNIVKEIESEIEMIKPMEELAALFRKKEENKIKKIWGES